MKTKTLLLLCLCLFAGINAFADAVEIDGIYYNLFTKVKQAEVTMNPNGYNGYTGIIIIPSIVTYENVDYNVTSIGDRAFGDYVSNNSVLTSITIPNSVTSIGNYAFANCKGLTSLTIPNSVTSIGSYAFGGCNGLTSLTISNGVSSISSNTFAGCRGLTSLTIPNSVTSIGEKAFSYCTGLTSITIPNSVTSIGSSAFSHCTGLTSLPIPYSVTSISSNAFESCTGLTSITIPNSVTSIGNNAFQDCTGLTSITIPNSAINIGEFAFYRCTGLTSITIPNSVTYIGSSAFYGCGSLTSVTIGSSVQRLYGGTFSNCPELTDVYCLAVEAPIVQSSYGYGVANAFEGSYIEYATLHVHEASIESYKTMEPWSGFGHIVSIENGEEPVQKVCAKPTISYANGELTFKCETEGAEFVSTITDTDVKQHYEASISLSATYHISVYATKTGYDNSEEATATLCWIDVEPKTEGLEDAIAEVKALPVLIQSDGSTITVQGADEGIEVAVYSINGMLQASALAEKGSVTLNTSLQTGTIALVKIGRKTIKVLMK